MASDQSVSRTSPGRGSNIRLLTGFSLLLLHLQDARQKFRSVLVEATVKLDELLKKIAKAVDESKPYWEARRLARQVSQPESQPVSQTDQLTSR